MVVVCAGQYISFVYVCALRFTHETVSLIERVFCKMYVDGTANLKS